MLLELLRAAFPICSSTIPSSFYEAKRKLHDLGLGYETIHACKYDYVLYWKEFIDLQHCPTCGEARYKEGCADMRWHRDKRVEMDDVLRHPTDFNPFGQMSMSYSMWPIVLLPYNFPPWKCMKETNFFMSLLIPSPRSPNREIDVYLQPLIEELKELWTFGVRTLTGQFFQLYAALLWTINDFPAYGDLSAWRTKGYQACPLCMGNRSSFVIRGRISFMGHKRYLPDNHVSYRSRLHDGKIECRAPPVNVCDNLVGTLLNIEGKTKDTMNARLDLQDLKIKKNLHLVKVGNRLVKPHANYTLTSSERVEFCKFLKSVKFPDGFVSKTRFTRDERNDDSIVEDEIIGDFEIFKQKVQLLDTSSVRAISQEKKRLFHWKHLRLQHRHAQNAINLYKRHKRAFPEWFRAQMLELRESANLFDDFFSLAMEPSFDVCCYNGCIVGGLRFHTVELDSRRTTQNSGGMIIDQSNASGSGDNNFYGVLDEVFHQVDDHIEDDTLCRIEVDPTIVERSVVRHVTDDFINDVDEHLSHASDDDEL
ncbi:putative transposase [Cucumis melo var. makuwa]|uniref:Transposase n=1 Tax=Cucumis melo var. makuwa TaxID=1194695 RepID=A0A5A7SVA2_CUCMM|nr:putative transposase [Cucumis melo var. makuwa]TYK17124.1 putative transposase [Cucumis melo var. makuwa]